MNRVAAIVLAVAALVGATVAGCRRAPEPDTALRERVERGPYSVEITITPGELEVGDRGRIVLEALLPADYAPIFPKPDALEGLTIDESSPATRAADADGQVRWRRSYRFTALSSGESVVPELTIGYGRAVESSEGESLPEIENELVTPPLRFEVRSALTDADSPVVPRDITGVVDAPAEPLNPWVVAAWTAGAALLALVGWTLLRWMIDRARVPAPPLPAEVLARRALRDLEDRNVFERDGPRAFYYQLSEIVRTYVERKFDVAAPDMTTEEFLRSLTTGRARLPYEHERLREFLEACDLVKYAALEPRADEGRAAIGRARVFIDATAQAAAALAAAERKAVQSDGRAA